MSEKGTMSGLIHQDDLIEVYHGDARDFPEIWADGGSTLIVDPPWHDLELIELAARHSAGFDTVLVFTDGRRFGQAVSLFGPPTWVFTWDTQNTWSVSASAPVQQTKHCLMFGDRYDRDAQLWGESPPERNHPTTKQVPLDGRRLTDLWSESIRWLHNPTAGRPAGGRGNDRHKAQSQHAKPLGWITSLIGNTTRPGELVFDPFAGTGTTARACANIGRRCISIEVEGDMALSIVDRLGPQVLPLGL